MIELQKKLGIEIFQQMKLELSYTILFTFPSIMLIAAINRLLAELSANLDFYFPLSPAIFVVFILNTKSSFKSSLPFGNGALTYEQKEKTLTGFFFLNLGHLIQDK